ncbi:MAG: polyprenyl synthetase family protein [Bacillota bacterium]|nr:polyprenyl synthetase family protein [Bacillota bacterium]
MEITKQQLKIEENYNKLDFTSIPQLKVIEMELLDAISDSRGTIREMCNHILKAGGKRIRPLLVVFSGLIFEQNLQKLIPTAVSSELIHMASLVHDDIVDVSIMRRNKPSINSVWGNNFAVLGGDYLFAKAFGILASQGLLKSMGFMVEAIESMCHGEIIQAEDKFNCECSIEKYYEKISCKTAIFLKCCCQAGASAVGASEKEVELIGEYGLNLGLAFQITDDILDLCGSSEIMGKPKSEDLKQGIISMPVIYLLKNRAHQSFIKSVIENKVFDEETILKVCSLLTKTGIMEKCYDTVKTHLEKAKRNLDALPESYHKEFLYRLADMVYTRIN